MIYNIILFKNKKIYIYIYLNEYYYIGYKNYLEKSCIILHQRDGKRGIKESELNEGDD